MKLERTSEQEKLATIVQRFSERKVVVVGDLVADQFLYGEISRVSREAPVLILRHERTETTPGGAANAAVNLAALGARAVLIGATGSDAVGIALREKLYAARVDFTGVVSSQTQQTATKVRILAGQIHSTRQQVIRIDYESPSLIESAITETLRAHLNLEANEAEAIIISDYNYGVADELMIKTAREVARRRNIPVLVDSRFRLKEFADFTSATPNEDEVEQLLERKFRNTVELARAGEKLRAELNYQALLVTRGSNGMMLFEANKEPLQIEPVGAREPVDVTGAGDTVIATYALALASGASFADAARIANYAGGLVVMKRGTASVTCQELLSSILHV